MDAVTLDTVREWEHRMYRWLDGGLSARDAHSKSKHSKSARGNTHLTNEFQSAY